MLTPEQRSQRARIAALARWSKEDSKPVGPRLQTGLRAKFDREAADQFPDLPPAELARRSDAAYRAHMARIALKSSRVRQARAAEKRGDADAVA